MRSENTEQVLSESWGLKRLDNGEEAASYETEVDIVKMGWKQKLTSRR